MFVKWPHTFATQFQSDNWPVFIVPLAIVRLRGVCGAPIFTAVVATDRMYTKIIEGGQESVETCHFLEAKAGLSMQTLPW